MKLEKWKEIKNFDFQDTSSLLRYMNENNYIYSPWIKNIVEKYNYSYSSYVEPISLYRVYLKDLEFNNASKLSDIYNIAQKKGFKLVNPEIAFLTRLLYTDQPTGEWLRFATPMNSMIDDDGVPHLPKIGKALNSFFLETYWSYPDAIFHPHNEFIFQK